MLLKLRLALAFTVATFLIGCGGGGIEYTPLTESETLMFSDSIKEAIDYYDLQFFLGHQDKNRLRQRVESWGEEARVKGSLAGIFLDQFDLSDGVLLGDPSQGTHWTYVFQNRIFTNHDPDSSSLVQIRVHDVEFGYEYFTFLVESRKSSRGAKAIIADYFLFTSGEWVSETAYEMAALEAAIMKLPEAEQSRVNESLEKAVFLIETGEYHRAESLLTSLPEPILQRKNPARMWLEATMFNGERSFNAALDHYRTNFPNDLTIHRVTFERASGLGRYQAAHAHLDEAEETLGGTDAYMQNIRAALWAMMEIPDSATACLERAIQLEPDYPESYLSLFYHFLSQKNHEGAIRLLGSLKNFGYDLEKLSLEKYPDFLNSEYFQAFVAASESFPGDKEEVEKEGRTEGGRQNADG